MKKTRTLITTILLLISIGSFGYRGQTNERLSTSKEVYKHESISMQTNVGCDSSFLGTTNLNWFGQSVLANDGNIVSVGTSDHIYNWSNGDIVLNKYDQDLNLIWTKMFYAGGGMDVASGLIATSDGGYLINSAFGNSNAAGVYSAGYIIKTDSLGNEEWTTTLTGQSFGDNYASLAVENSNGEFICFGQVQHHAGCSGYALRITKLSSNGSIVWSNCRPENPDWNGGIIKLASSDEYIAVWNDNSTGNVELWKWDDSGNRTSVQNFKFMNTYNSRGNLKRNPSGGFLLLGQYDSTSTQKNAFVSLFDDSMNLIWETSYSNQQESYFFNATFDNLGNIICTGQTVMAFQAEDIPVVMFSPTGSLLLDLTYGSAVKKEYAKGIIALPNGEVVCSGTSDSLGLLIKFCDFKSISLSAENSELRNIEIGLFPNPATDHVNLEFRNSKAENYSVLICNSLGQVVYVSNQEKSVIGNNQQSISTKEFLAGIYFIQIKIGNQIFTKKLIKS